MKQDEYDNFKRFIFRTYDACTAEKEPPSIGKVEMYFIALIDKTFDEVVQNTSRRLLRDNKYFPEICEMRGEDEITLEAKALEDFEKIKKIIKGKYKITEEEKEHLLPLYKKWFHRFIGDEMEGVLLSQFLKSYKMDVVIYNEKQLPLKTQKLINGIINNGE